MFGSTRIHVRRNEDPARVRALLVDVVDDLRIPRRVERVHRVARLGLRERVPVAVVVVADVVVVELRRRRPFRLRAERRAVPVADDVHAVRILRRHEDDDRVREDRARLRRVAAREAVGEHERRGEAADFGGVDRRRDEDDVLPVGEQRLELVVPAQPRVHQLALDHLVARRGCFSVAESEMKTARNGRPSVVLPSVRTCTRGLAFSTAWK